MALVVAPAAAPILQFFDNNGIPLVGGQLATTVGGVSYPAYADSLGTIPLANPIILNSRGEVCTVSGQSTPMYLDPTVQYVFSLSDANGNPIYSPGNIEGLLTLSSVSAIVNQAYIGQTLYPITPAEAALAVTPSSFIYQEGDIRRYGALASATDNSVALNTALQVSGSGGRSAYIPTGNWAYTATPVAPLSSSMFGSGQGSVLAPNGCDGLTFSNQTFYGGARYFRDFAILGQNTSTNMGLGANFSAASGIEVRGITFENLTIENFGKALSLRGFWNCCFYNLFCYNNFVGCSMVGQNIINNFYGCFWHRGTITGTGTSMGIDLESTAGESSQSQHFLGCAVYNYDINVEIGFAFNTQLESCDLSQARTTCIDITTTIGSTTIRDCWIETWNAATGPVRGIKVNSLGTAQNYLINIEGNHITCDLCWLGSIGIDVGTGQLGVRVRNNRVEQFPICISNASNTFLSSGNSCNATGAPWNSAVAYVTNQLVNSGGQSYICTAPNTNQSPPNASFWALTFFTFAHNFNSLATNMSIGPTTVQTGQVLQFNALTPAGFAYFDQGSFTATLTGFSGTVTGTVNYRALGGQVELWVAGAGIFGTSNATTMTLTGLPAFLWPTTDQTAMANVVDNGVGSYGPVVISASTGTLSFRKDATGAVFTASGSKAVNGTTITYSYG